MAYIGIEIGGTKIQAALGHGDGKLLQTWRGAVEPAKGATGILDQLKWGVADLKRIAIERNEHIKSVGIGYGGPVDTIDQSVIKSHHIQGWDGFPLAQWFSDQLELPCVMANDADVAGLGEAVHGAGRGKDPFLYMTIGSGIGGGFISNGCIYPGQGRGAAEIGHIRVDGQILEHWAAGWGIQNRYFDISGKRKTGQELAALARVDEPHAKAVFDKATDALAEAITHAITLLCPQRVVIGGGVSLVGDLLFEPLRRKAEAITFAPYKGLTDIVPAELGEEVVLHGAIELAKGKRV